MDLALLRLSTFKGMQNLAVLVAQQHGLFTARGLAVEIAFTRGSAAQIAALANGECDVAQTAPDNVINAGDNPAAFGLDAGTAPRMLMLMGGSVGVLGLYARPEVRAMTDLRGTMLGVDNPGSGFALVLRDLLARAGLRLDHDYQFVQVGGTSERLAALRSGAVSATILYTPFDALAEQEGFPRLAGSEQIYDAYASLATAASAAWIAAHREIAAHYIAAIREALRIIYAPDRAQAIQAVIRAALELDQSQAARAYSAFVDPRAGFGIDAILDQAGLRQVIDLRSTYGAPRHPLRMPAAYQDLGPYHAASALLA